MLLVMSDGKRTTRPHSLSDGRTTPHVDGSGTSLGRASQVRAHWAGRDSRFVDAEFAHTTTDVPAGRQCNVGSLERSKTGGCRAT